MSQIIVNYHPQYAVDTYSISVLVTKYIIKDELTHTHMKFILTS